MEKGWGPQEENEDQSREPRQNKLPPGSEGSMEGSGSPVGVQSSSGKWGSLGRGRREGRRRKGEHSWGEGFGRQMSAPEGKIKRDPEGL